MRIFITGARGQVGRALQEALIGHELILANRPELDVSQRQSAQAAIHHARPDLVIHAAAHTHVDDCARQPALAYQVNGLGAQNVALACRSVDAALLYISTNEVFSGANPAGYDEWNLPDPINAYGRSKAAGEFYVRSLLTRCYIVRTAWVFAAGGRNFIHAILERARRDGQVQVVADEIGNPTYAADLAAGIARLIASEQYGVYHLVNEGVCSRWAFATEILRQAGLPEVRNLPILSSQFQRDSTPPRFGGLRNNAAAALGITLRPWQQALADYLADPNVGVFNKRMVESAVAGEGLAPGWCEGYTVTHETHEIFVPGRNGMGGG